LLNDHFRNDPQIGLLSLIRIALHDRDNIQYPNTTCQLLPHDRSTEPAYVGDLQSQG
jgi:hypothetical protein